MKYAQFDHTATAPQPVIGWYDADEFTYPNLPAAADLLTVTQAQWDNRFNTPFVSSGSLVAAPVPTSAQLLATAKSAQIAILASAYNTAIQQSVSYMSTTFQADSASQQTLTRCLVAGSVPTGFYWLDANNVQVSMTFAQLQGLASAMLVQGQTAFTRLQTRKASVNSATTDSAVQAVVW